MSLFIKFFSSCFDWCDQAHQKRWLEQWIVRLAAWGFVIHLALIALSGSFQVLQTGILAGLDRNFLHALYTPFSFILFYEVLLLVIALPRSQTSSMGKQYEIVSLIVIRRVFKDIGEFRGPVGWLTQTDESFMVIADMVAAVFMFLLVTGFRHISQTVVHSRSHEQLHQFLAVKKSVAGFLCATLLILAAWNFGQWLIGVLAAPFGHLPEGVDLDVYFFPTFFEFMIFADVFLLILSIPFYERYEYVFRNAGFVISTILLRLSLSTPKPYDLIIGLVAMVYGLCVLGVFSYFTRINRAEVADDLKAH
ncbi:MAG: hypothetical protein NTW75_00715 [Planctomycetales bacterium]|nr:hypothetical protein [Planctomycetales bacterium]